MLAIRVPHERSEEWCLLFSFGGTLPFKFVGCLFLFVVARGAAATEADGAATCPRA